MMYSLNKNEIISNLKSVDKSADDVIKMISSVNINKKVVINNDDQVLEPSKIENENLNLVEANNMLKYVADGDVFETYQRKHNYLKSFKNQRIELGKWVVNMEDYFRKEEIQKVLKKQKKYRGKPIAEISAKSYDSFGNKTILGNSFSSMFLLTILSKFCREKCLKG